MTIKHGETREGVCAFYVTGPSSNSSISAQVDLTYGYSDYHFSWRHDYGRKYDWQNANYYCNSLGYGWQGISIESYDEDAALDNVLYQGQYRPA